MVEKVLHHLARSEEAACGPAINTARRLASCPKRIRATDIRFMRGTQREVRRRHLRASGVGRCFLGLKTGWEVNKVDGTPKGLSPDEKLARMLDQWLSPQDVRFATPEAEQRYQERLTRVINAIQLKVPDRVPVYVNGGFFPAYYAGVTPEDVMYDYDKLCRAWQKQTQDFQPDVYGGSAIPGPGRAYELLDYKLYRWPGHGTPPDTSYQCVEAEYMMAEEYDAFIKDPCDFWTRVYLPRIFGALKPFQNLPFVLSTVEMAFTGAYFIPFGMPDVRSALEALLAAGQEAMRWIAAVAACDRALLESGFPSFLGGWSKAPFDTLADTLRGTRGIALDMYRRPDKLLEAMERLVPLMIEMGVSGTRMSGRPLVFIPLHKGADGFMSDEQFERFYWPTLKKVILGLIGEGLLPFLFAEGGYNTRLHAIKDVPRGKTVWLFDATDMAKAKEILGGTACIAGNVPTSLLSAGTPDQVKAYCRQLIDVAGKGGGFILTNGAVLDRVKAETVRTMVEFTKEYGVYR